MVVTFSHAKDLCRHVIYHTLSCRTACILPFCIRSKHEPLLQVFSIYPTELENISNKHFLLTIPWRTFIEQTYQHWLRNISMVPKSLALLNQKTFYSSLVQHFLPWKWLRSCVTRFFRKSFSPYTEVMCSQRRSLSIFLNNSILRILKSEQCCTH